jgi:hypothetical protein
MKNRTRRLADWITGFCILGFLEGVVAAWRGNLRGVSTGLVALLLLVSAQLMKKGGKVEWWVLVGFFAFYLVAMPIGCGGMIHSVHFGAGDSIILIIPVALIVLVTCGVFGVLPLVLLLTDPPWKWKSRVRPGELRVVSAKQIPDLITATQFLLLRRIVRAAAGPLCVVSFFFFAPAVYESLFERGTEAQYMRLALPLIMGVLIGSFWAFVSFKPLAVLVSGILGVVVSLVGISVILAIALPGRPKAVASEDLPVRFFEVALIGVILLLVWRIILFRIVSKPSWIVRLLMDGLGFVLMLFMGSLAFSPGSKEEAKYLQPIFFLPILFWFLWRYASLVEWHRALSKTLGGLEPDKALLGLIGDTISQIKGADVQRASNIIELRFRTKPKRCRVSLGEDMVVLLPMLTADLELFQMPFFLAKAEFNLHIQAETESRRNPMVTVHLFGEDERARISAEHLRKYREWAGVGP